MRALYKDGDVPLILYSKEKNFPSTNIVQSAGRTGYKYITRKKFLRAITLLERNKIDSINLLVLICDNLSYRTIRLHTD